MPTQFAGANDEQLEAHYATELERSLDRAAKVTVTIDAAAAAVIAGMVSIAVKEIYRDRQYPREAGLEMLSQLRDSCESSGWPAIAETIERMSRRVKDMIS